MLELAAARGADFAWWDLEHTASDIKDIYQATRASDAADLPLLLRLGVNDDFDIASALDSGAIGVIVSHVSSAEDAERIVAAARFAPDGQRSICPFMRAGRWVGPAGWNQYWREANDQTVVGVIIENAEGLKNLEEIIAVPGIDLVMIGGGDLSQSLGLATSAGQLHPEIERAKLDTLRHCAKYGKASLHLLVPGDERVDIEAFLRWHEAGFRIFTWPDVALFATILEDKFSQARSAVGQPAASHR
jgi:4-hydroxy-2-oxoheptanedioate aldolase